MAIPISGWSFYRLLTDTAVAGLTNYVCKVSLTSANFDFTLAKSDGSDLRIQDDNTNTILPIWLFDYDSVLQIATIFYLAADTTHEHSLNYGNSGATAVSSFSAVFIHGTGYDSGFGDLTANVSGSGTATRVAKSTGNADARQRRIYRRSQTPNIAGTVNGATLVRDFALLTDPFGNIVPDAAGHWIGFYANMNGTTPPYKTYRAISADQGLTWTNHTQVLTAGSSGAFDDQGARSASSAIKFGPTDYRMWYTSNGSTASGGVGLATSTDGITWTKAGVVINNANSGLTAGVGGSLSGVPCVRKLADGTFVMFCEARPSTGTGYPWSVVGWTSPSAATGTWTVMNSGSYVITGAGAGFASNGCANPHFVEITPGSLYAIFAQGFTGTLGTADITTFNGQGGWWTSTTPNGPYSVDSNSPMFGRDSTVSGFGEEAGGHAIDPNGNWVTHMQDYTSTDNSAGSLYRIFPVTGQGGLILSPNVNDGEVVGCTLSAGNFTAEHRYCITAHRSNNGAWVSLGLADSATAVSPNVSATFGALVRVAIRIIPHGGAANQLDSTPGNFSVIYNDASAVTHYWDGTAWTTTSLNTIAGSSDLSRFIIASIQDDGTNFILSARYADTDVQIFSAPIAKASVKAFSAGRALFTGDPFTNAWQASGFSRWIGVRPYSAVEPVMIVGPNNTLHYNLTSPAPAAALTGVLSANFLLQAASTPSPDLIATLTDFGGGGSFVPATVTMSDTAAHAFTYSNATPGIYRIGATHTGGGGTWNDPPALNFAVTPGFFNFSSVYTGPGIPLGLTTTGFEILWPDLSVYQTRTTAGVVLGLAGYTVSLNLPTVGKYIIQWDTGVAPLYYSWETSPNSSVTSTVAVDSLGRVILQPIQTGVTIPTVTAVSSPVPSNLLQVSGTNIPAPHIPGVMISDVGYVAGAAALIAQGTLTSATSSSITFPATDSINLTSWDDTRYQYIVVDIVGGAGQGQRLLTTTKSGVRTFGLLAGTMPAQVDSTSQYVIVGSWQSNVNGYATGQDPATLLLVTPANKIATDSSNRVVANTTLIAGQTAIAAGSVTFPGTIGTSVYAGGPVASVTTAVRVDLSTPLTAARQLDAVADTSLTMNDAMHCAISENAGKEAITGTSYVKKTPSTGTVLRTFTIDSNTNPSTRN